MKKNILIFTHSPATQFIDISNQYTRLFDSEKYDVTVVYLVGKYDEISKKRHLTTNVIFLDFSRKSVRGLKITAIKILLNLCREKKFEMVICHRYKPIYIMLWVSLFCSIPKLFFIMHTLGTLKSIPRKLLIAALAKKNMTFAGVSNAVRDDMRKNIWRIPPYRIITLYNVIDVELTEPALLDRKTAREKLQLPETAFIFGQIGRLAREKDQVTLLHAFAKTCMSRDSIAGSSDSIAGSTSNTLLLLIGDGKLEKEMRQLADTLKIKDNVIFTGFIPGAFQYIRAFDIYILSSTTEAFGRVLLEAMIAQVPVIATRIDGVPEVIGNAGVLIPAKNPTMLAEAMLTARHLPETDRLAWGEKGYARVVKNFSIPPFYKTFWGNETGE